MKRLLVLSPTSRERNALPELARELDIELILEPFDEDYFDQFLGKQPPEHAPTLDILRLIDETIERYKGKIDGVTSALGYPGMSAASIIARRLGLPGPDPYAVMLCEHKYYSRLAQSRIVPEAGPDFYLIDPDHPDDALAFIKEFPMFLKPVKSCMSINAFRIDSAVQLQERVRSSLLPKQFIEPFNQMWHTYGDSRALCASYLLAESLLTGQQVSLEGYVYQRKVRIFGVLDAVMFPGTQSFQRFQYPSLLPPAVLDRMHNVARQFITGIGYDNALFNIELIYNADSDTISIIEINPKIASQFPDLFHKVDGTSTYKTMMQIALGMAPDFVPGQGSFACAASCVLRTFEDGQIISTPSQQDLSALQKRYPDAHPQICVAPGKKLSDFMQDTGSYRYGLINIGAESPAAIEQKFEHCKEMLSFTFQPLQYVLT